MVNIPLELTKYKCPKLILQPIVENALWLGILESNAKTGTIQVSAYKDGGNIVFDVKDNGMGMTK